MGMPKKQIRVRVTQTHIKTGTRHPWRCPFALAIRAVFPRAASVEVGFETVSVDGTGYFLSKNAESWIRRFVHDHDSVRPGTFIMRTTRRRG